jgi:hypothetical protein
MRLRFKLARRKMKPGFEYEIACNGIVVGYAISEATTKQDAREEMYRHADELGFVEGVDYDPIESQPDC